MRKPKRNFSKVKILKPKAGYSHFKVFGRVFRYREQDVRPTAFWFNEYIMTEYGAIAECDDNKCYVVHFHRKKESTFHSISNPIEDGIGGDF